MKPIGAYVPAPGMVGGLATSFLMELLVYPAVYYLWKKKEVSDDGSVTSPALAA